MKLTDDVIKKIEVNLEPGYILELSVDKENHLIVNKRPLGEGAITFPPVLLSAGRPVTLQINAKVAGQDPISILQQLVEPNVWIRGIMTCPGISQEIKDES